jgi:hypothetical protein
MLPGGVVSKSCRSQADQTKGSTGDTLTRLSCTETTVL